MSEHAKGRAGGELRAWMHGGVFYAELTRALTHLNQKAEREADACYAEENVHAAGREACVEPSVPTLAQRVK